MNFTYVDGIVAAVVLLSAFLAYNRGFTRELFAIGGWVLAGLVAFFFAPKLEPLMRELPLVGEQLARSCVISMIASFAIIVALGLLILAVFTPILASAVLESALGPVDRALGFLFGVARGVALLAIAYLIYTQLSGAELLPALADAASKPFFDDVAELIDANRPDELPGWFKERIDALMVPCQGGVQPTSDS